jgi:hypothetical protein
LCKLGQDVTAALELVSTSWKVIQHMCENSRTVSFEGFWKLAYHCFDRQFASDPPVLPTRLPRPSAWLIISPMAQ